MKGVAKRMGSNPGGKAMAFKKAKAADKPMTKAQIIQAIAEETQLKKVQIFL
jgi:hypothetical protein